MSRRTKWIIAIATTVVIAGSASAALAAGSADGQPVDDTSRQKAEEAAIAHTGGGSVLEVETDDGAPGYEVEVRRPDGGIVEVHLDPSFQVTGSGTDDTDDADTDDTDTGGDDEDDT